MRIIGYIEHPVLKITVFQMDNRVSVKFETSLYEQVYKFRDGTGVSDLEAVKNLVGEDFINGVLREMESMHKIKQEALTSINPEEDDEFEEII